MARKDKLPSLAIQTEHGRAAVFSASAKNEIEADIQKTFERIGGELLAHIKKATAQAVAQFADILKTEEANLSSESIERFGDRATKLRKEIEAKLMEVVNRLLNERAESLVHQQL